MYAIHSTERLQVFYEAGSRDEAVFSFSGVGRGLNFIQREEFANALKDSNVTRQVVYIVDRSRTWYNATAAEILEVLEPAARHFPAITTLGNSMGGFGAMFFASRFPQCRRAIAFCPQYAVQPGLMPATEDRWADYRNGIGAHTISHALSAASPQIEYLVFFGADDARDMDHAALFRNHPDLNVRLHVIDRCDHNVAAFLRDRGALHALLNLLIAKAAPASEIAPLLRSHGVDLL